MFLKQRQISGRHYTELLNGSSRACGASFVEIIRLAPGFPKNQSWPRGGDACNRRGERGHSSETVSSRIKQVFLGVVTKIEVRSAVCCKSTGRTLAEL